MIRDFLAFIGGPSGRHSYPGGPRSARWWTPLRIILAGSAVFLALGWLQKANCLRTGISPSGPFVDWSGQPQYTSACYSDVVVLFRGRGFDQGVFPYAFSFEDGGLTRYLEYPVVTGLFQYLMSLLTRPVYAAWEAAGLSATTPTAVNFGITAIFLAACWMAACAIIAMLAGNRRWDSLLMALSPLVIVHAFTNYDTLSILIAVVAIALWAKGKPSWTGIVLGLGIAAKLWPIFILGAIMLLSLRLRAWHSLARVTSGALISWTLVNLPIYLLYPQAWMEFFRLNSTRGWEGSTIYAVLAHLTGHEDWSGLSPSNPVAGVEQFNTITFVLLLSLLLALTFVVLTAPRCPRLGQIMFLAVLAFMITNKVWSPQYSLWLVPLIVLALPRWRLTFIWGAVEAVYWYLRMWQFLPQQLAAPDWLVDTFTVIRLALLVWMATLIIRQIYGLSPDPVRQSHAGKDPLIGSAAFASGRMKA